MPFPPMWVVMITNFRRRYASQPSFAPPFLRLCCFLGRLPGKMIKCKGLDGKGRHLQHGDGVLFFYRGKIAL